MATSQFSPQQGAPRASPDFDVDIVIAHITKNLRVYLGSILQWITHVNIVVKGLGIVFAIILGAIGDFHRQFVRLRQEIHQTTLDGDVARTKMTLEADVARKEIEGEYQFRKRNAERQSAIEAYDKYIKAAEQRYSDEWALSKARETARESLEATLKSISDDDSNDAGSLDDTQAN